MHLDRRLLGWGIFFILVGAVPLAVRFGNLDPQVVGRWPSLWPVLLIAWGIGLLFRRTPLELLGGGLAAVTFGLMGGGLLASGFGGVPSFTGCGGDASGTPFPAQSGSFGGPGRLNVEFSCGDLVLAAVDGSDWRVSGTDVDGRAPRVTAEGSEVTIETSTDASPFGSGGRAEWNVALPRGQALALGLTMNAGDAAVDLPGANLSSFNLTLNAGNARVGLAAVPGLGDVNATVNAGNATVLLPAGARSVNLSLNAGNLDVCVPANAALRVRWSGALGSNDLADAGLTEIEDDTWATPGFDQGQPFTDLRVSANAGSFGLDTDGTCDD